MLLPINFVQNWSKVGTPLRFFGPRDKLYIPHPSWFNWNLPDSIVLAKRPEPRLTGCNKVLASPMVALPELQKHDRQRRSTKYSRRVISKGYLFFLNKGRVKGKDETPWDFWIRKCLASDFCKTSIADMFFSWIFREFAEVFECPLISISVGDISSTPQRRFRNFHPR